MPGEFCPRCGTPRVGAFRFCRSCQFDFETLPLTAPPSVASGPTASPPSDTTSPAPGLGSPGAPMSFSERYRTAELVTPSDASSATANRRRSIPYPIAGYLVASLILGGALLLLLNALSHSSATPSPVPAANANTPPAGVVWFGTSFDPRTFVVSGRTDTFPAGQPVAVVGHLSETIPQGQQITISVDGYAFSTGTAPSGGADLWGIVITPGWFTATAGPAHAITFTDVGGNVLASGSVTIGR
jgi:hypothetical protein